MRGLAVDVERRSNYPPRSMRLLLPLIGLLVLTAIAGCTPFGTLDGINDQFEHHHHK